MFDPKQVKYATENIGTFGENEPRFRYQVAARPSPEFAMDGTIADSLPAHLREDARAIIAERANTPAWMADPDGTPTDLSERDWLRREAEARHNAPRFSIGTSPSPAELAEAQRQYDEVVARYTNQDGTRKPGWLKAPNGADTHLTERQWVQVRTPNFRNNFFGDWLSLALRDAIEATEPIDFERPVDGEMLELVEGYRRGDAVTEKKIIEWAIGQLPGGPISTPIGPVTISRGNIRSILHHAQNARTRGPLKVLTLPYLAKMLEKAVLYDERADGADYFYNFAHRISFDGVPYIARIIVKREADGGITYDTEFTEEKKLSGALATRTGAPAEAETAPARPTTDTLLKALYKVKPENVSKVVDENGEPLVVAHSTDAEFTVFRDMQKNDAGWLGAGFYFFGDRSLDGQYGRNVMECFLNVREPYFISGEERDRLAESDDADASAEFSEEIRGEGYDGVYYNGDLNQEWAVFSPSQVKSATDNLGMFSARPDIRYSVSAVTPAEDAAYMDAVRRGDMETAQRMVREAAKRAMRKPVLAYKNTRGSFFIRRDKNKSAMFFSAGFDQADSYYGRAVNKAPSTSVDFTAVNSEAQLIKAFENAGIAEELKSSDAVRIDNEQHWLTPSIADEIRRGKWGADKDGRQKLVHDSVESVISWRGELGWENIKKAVIRAAGENTGAYFIDTVDFVEFDANGAYWDDLKNATKGKFATTDEMQAYADEHHVGFVIKNVKDTIASGREKAFTDTDYIVPQTVSIKSAAPVTYDDAGNVIPLSQRFNPERDDIRYQVAARPSPEFAMDGTIADSLPAHLREDARRIIEERAGTPAWMADPDGAPTDLSERDWLRREAERRHDAASYQVASAPTAADLAEARRQNDEVVARYTNPDGTKKPGWMKAPNGADTHLDERQWVQVRTPNFRNNFFGDWLAYEVSRLSESGISLDEARRRIDEMRGRDFVNEETGVSVRLSSDARGKLVSNKATGKSKANGFTAEQHNEVAAKVGDLFAIARRLESRPDRDGDANILSIQRYAAPVRIGEQTAFAWITVKESKQHGAHIYSVEEIKLEALARKVGQAETDTTHAASASTTQILRQLAEKVKPENVSKVVDENGEPRVVYHGSNHTHSIFDNRKSEYRNGTPDGVTFFTDMRDVASSYTPGGHGEDVVLDENDRPFIDVKFNDGHVERQFYDLGGVYATYLSLRNPLVVDASGAEWSRILFEGKRLTTNEIADIARVRGFDGVVFKNVVDGAMRHKPAPSTTLASFSPSQVKSATDNAGTFSGANPDIRYSVTPTEDAAYMDAVTRGDMDAAQRMVREAAAKAMPHTKVVDDNGGPLVVFHGTTNEETRETWNPRTRTFDIEHSPFTVFRRRVDGVRNSGAFFNSSEDNAGGYGSRVYKVFLNLRNPLVVDANNSDYSHITHNGATRDTYEWAEWAERNGYDGLIIKNVRDGVDYGAMSSATADYVAFRPSQIKSADPVTYDDAGNVIPLSQRFNPANEDIRYSIGTFADGTKFVHVDVGQEVFDGKSIKDYPKIAHGEIINRFRGRVIGTGENKAFVKTDTAGEYAYAGPPLDKAEKAAKMRASTELDHLLDAGRFIEHKDDDGGHPEAIGGWDYYDAIFEVGGKYFTGKINVLINKRGRVFHDVTDIKEDTRGVMTRHGEPLGQFLGVSPVIQAQTPSDVKRYQIAGGVGAEALGIRNLADAEAMERSGADRTAIWRETGWWRGRDGEWRVEIPDFAIADRNFAHRLMTGTTTTLGDLLPPDSALFRAYPSLASLRVYEGRRMGVGVAGQWNGNSIEIAAGAMMDERTFRSILAHEVQHVVQRIEGFAPGGSEETFAENVIDAESIRQRMFSPELSEEEYERLRRRLEEIEENALDGSVEVDGDVYEDEFDAYRHLAGEADARLVQKRLGMTPAERAARPPWEDYDVDEDRQIVRFSVGLVHPWPEGFPNVMIHTTRAAVMAKHAGDFAAAKAGDWDAADRLVLAVVKPDRIKALVERHPNAIVVPVNAEEATGNNRIPAAYAKAVSDAGLEYGAGIVQSVRAHHTGADAIGRLLRSAEFDGPVQAGREYVLVDDHVTQGGTLNELRNYIEERGGKVVEISCLTASKGSTILPIRKATLDALAAKFGQALQDELQAAKIAGRIDALTESQGRYLLKLSPDTLRDRSAAEGLRRGREAPGLPGSVQVGAARAGAERAAGEAPRLSLSSRYGLWDGGGPRWTGENYLVGIAATMILAGREKDLAQKLGQVAEGLQSELSPDEAVAKARELLRTEAADRARELVSQGRAKEAAQTSAMKRWAEAHRIKASGFAEFFQNYSFFFHDLTCTLFSLILPLVAARVSALRLARFRIHPPPSHALPFLPFLRLLPALRLRPALGVLLGAAMAQAQAPLSPP